MSAVVDSLLRLRRQAWEATVAAEVVLAHGPRRIAVAAGSAGLVEDLAARLDPFLPSAEGSSEPSVRVMAIALDPGEEARRALASGCEVVVDASLYPTNTCGRRTDLGDGSHAVSVDRTGTVCLVAPGERAVHIFQPDEGLLRLDTERLVKGLATVLAEVDGELVVHASGVVTPGGDAVLYPGDSRNGKTTVLLHTLARFHVAMLSCDTTFLRVEGDELRARGWPSNFSLSTGTLHDFDFLYPSMTDRQRKLTYTEAWDIFPKEVLDTRDVIAAAGAAVVSEASVRSVVFLNFDPAAVTGLVRLTEPKEVKGCIEEVCLGSRDPLYPNWHGYRAVDDRRIDQTVDRLTYWITKRLPVYRMDWAPGPEQLLRHVQLLDAVSRNRSPTEEGR